MKLYAESSAVLAWLLGETPGESMRQTLAGAERVVASLLTLVECERTLLRAATLGHLKEAQVADRKATLAAAGAQWELLAVTQEILDRARRPFPGEPIRTLDALHLSSALEARTAVPDLRLLSLDRVVRQAGLALGFAVLPG